MRIQLLLFLIPFVSTIIVWLTGRLHLGLALTVFVVLEVVGFALLLFSFPVGMNDPSSGITMFSLSLVTATLAPWLAFLTGLALSPKRSRAPIENIVDAAKDGARATRAGWDTLDPSTKDKIVRGGRQAARFGLKLGAKALKKKGLVTAAAFVMGAKHFF